MIQCFSKLTAATTGAGTRFHHPWSGTVAWSATQSQQQSIISAPGRLFNLRAQAKTALGVGNSRDITLYKNGSATALTVAIGNDTNIHDDTTHSVTVAVGDLIAIGSTAGGTPTATIFALAIEFEGDNTAESIYGGPLATLGTGTVYHNVQAMVSDGDTALAIGDSQSCWPIDGTLTRFDIKLNTAPGGVTSRVFHVYVNGVAQDGTGGTPNTTITISGASTTGNSTFSLTLSPGDLVCFRAAVGAGTPAGSTWNCGFAFTADTDGEWAICSSGGDSFNNGSVNYGGQAPPNWDATEANVALIGNITPFQITGFVLELNAADNGRVFQTRVDGVDTGPIGTLAGGATTLTGSAMVLFEEAA